jgi:hypothetical protein
MHDGFGRDVAENRKIFNASSVPNLRLTKLTGVWTFDSGIDMASSCVWVSADG